MKTFKQGLLAAALLISIPSIACTPDAREGFVPKNNLKIFANQKSINGITEQQFNDVITKVETLYAPIISNMGATLQIERNWTDPTVNAYAQQMGKTWKVSMFGGLARHETITVDAMALVVCHEIGHHIGGAPRKVSPWSSPWASNEGQADYFATLKCLRHVFLNDNNSAVVKKLKAPAPLVAACAKAWPNKDDNAICVRNGMAGASVAGLFAALRNQPEAKFDTPDANVVTKTNDAHPAHQCRLDTYFQGALCEKGMNEEVSQKDEVQGTCHGTTGQTVGLRPLCWFKPKK